MPATALELVESGPLRYLVSTPASTTPNGAPVLCFLHGYDEAAPIAIESALTAHGPLSSTAPPIARERFLIVAPQLTRAGDLGHRSARDVLTIVADVVDRFGGDASRCLLTGFSFGGNGVFDLALAQPGRWRALWSVDPTRIPIDALADTPIWLSIGAAARRLAAWIVPTLDLRPAPKQADHPARPLEDSRLHLDEGLDHVGSAASAYADERIYEWLLVQADRSSADSLRPARS